MRTSLLAACTLALLFAACSSDTPRPSEARPAAPADAGRIVAVTIPVEGMTCAACAGSVRSTLREISGVRDVNVDLAQRSVRVTYAEASGGPERFTEAINRLGYRAGAPAPVRS